MISVRCYYILFLLARISLFFSFLLGLAIMLIWMYKYDEFGLVHSHSHCKFVYECETQFQLRKLIGIKITQRLHRKNENFAFFGDKQKCTHAHTLNSTLFYIFFFFGKFSIGHSFVDSCATNWWTWKIKNKNGCDMVCWKKFFVYEKRRFYWVE